MWQLQGNGKGMQMNSSGCLSSGIKLLANFSTKCRCLCNVQAKRTQVTGLDRLCSRNRVAPRIESARRLSLEASLIGWLTGQLDGTENISNTDQVTKVRNSLAYARGSKQNHCWLVCFWCHTFYRLR